MSNRYFASQGTHAWFCIPIDESSFVRDEGVRNMVKVIAQGRRVDRITLMRTKADKRCGKTAAILEKELAAFRKVVEGFDSTTSEELMAIKSCPPLGSGGFTGFTGLPNTAVSRIPLNPQAVFGRFPSTEAHALYRCQGESHESAKTKVPSRPSTRWGTTLCRPISHSPSWCSRRSAESNNTSFSMRGSPSWTGAPSFECALSPASSAFKDFRSTH